VRLFCVCVVLRVGSDLATGLSPVQGVLPTVYRIKKLRRRPRSKELWSHRDKMIGDTYSDFLYICNKFSVDAKYGI
jgi:hypothetical protein